jgi:iron complex transport system substrate-binding protein
LLSAVAALFLIGGALAMPALAERIAIRHFQGTTELEARPSRIFVYDLGILDILDALRIPVRGVPGSNVPPSLAKYKADSYAKIGTLFEPDYETVNAEKPDLILIGPRTSEKYTQLSALAPVVDRGQHAFSGRCRDQCPHDRQDLRQGGGGRGADQRARKVGR